MSVIEDQKKIMGNFATGVSIVTIVNEEKIKMGMTANSITSLSLSPPLVLFTIDNKNRILTHIKDNSIFTLNFLTSDQESLSVQFAKPGPKDFSNIDISLTTAGELIINNSLAYLCCKVYQIVPGGDHQIIIGKILRGLENDYTRPLIYFRGCYKKLA